MYKRILPQNGLHETHTAFAVEQVHKIVFYSGYVKQKYTIDPSLVCTRLGG